MAIHGHHKKCWRYQHGYVDDDTITVTIDMDMDTISE